MPRGLQNQETYDRRTGRKPVDVSQGWGKLGTAINDPSSMISASFKGMPYDPWVSRIGKVVDIMATPNMDQPEVWVQAAFHEIPHLLYSFGAKPFMIADAFNRFGQHHHKKSKIRMSQLSGALEGTYGFPSGVGWSMIKLGGDIGLKLLWWFFIADVSTEALVNWTSLAYEYAGINVGEHYCRCYHLEGPILSVGAADRVIVDNWALGAQRGYSGGGHVISAPKDESPSCGFSISVMQNPVGLPDASASFYLWEEERGFQATAKTEAVRGENGYGTAINMFRPFEYSGIAKNFMVLCDKSYGAVWISSGSWTCYGHKDPHHGIVADP